MSRRSKRIFFAIKTILRWLYDLQFLNDSCHTSIICHLSQLISTLMNTIDSKTCDMPTENSWNKNAGPDLLFEHPFDFEHTPIGLNCDGCQSFLLTMSFRFSIKMNSKKLITQFIGIKMCFYIKLGPAVAVTVTIPISLLMIFHPWINLVSSPIVRPMIQYLFHLSSMTYIRSE